MVQLCTLLQVHVYLYLQTGLAVDEVKEIRNQAELTKLVLQVCNYFSSMKCIYIANHRPSLYRAHSQGPCFGTMSVPMYYSSTRWYISLGGASSDNRKASSSEATSLVYYWCKVCPALQEDKVL